MPLLSGKKRQDLIDLLLSLPNIGDPASRNLLLADLPGPVQNAIPAAGAPAVHIANIVDTLNDEGRTQADGTVPLRIVLENAVYLVRGSRLAGQLQAVLDSLAAPPAAAGGAPAPVPAPAPAPTASLDRLTGAQRKQLYDALLSAFPTPTDLRRMVNFGLNENLDRITTGSGLGDLVLSLMTWAQAQGRMQDLVQAALADNPGSPEVHAFARLVGLRP
jgi:hypothetical protein